MARNSQLRWQFGVRSLLFVFSLLAVAFAHRIESVRTHHRGVELLKAAGISFQCEKIDPIGPNVLWWKAFEHAPAATRWFFGLNSKTFCPTTCAAVRIEGSNVDEKAIKHLCDLCNAETIFVSGTSLSQTAIEQLSRLKTVRNLSLQGGSVSDASLEPWSKGGVLIGSVLVARGYERRSRFLAAGATNVHSVACFPEKEDLSKLVQYAGNCETLKRISRPPETWDGDPEDANDPKGRPPSVHMPFRPSLSIKETLSLPQDLTQWLDKEDDRLYELDFDHDPFRLLGYCEHNNSGEDLLFGKPKLVQLMRLPSSEGPDYGMTDGSFSIFVGRDDLKAGNFQSIKTGFG